MSPETVAMDGKKLMDLGNIHEVESLLFDIQLDIGVEDGEANSDMTPF